MKSSLVVAASLMLAIIIFAVAFGAGTGEKVTIYPYKIVTYNPGKIVTEVTNPGPYVRFLFDASNGDSSTYGVDSISTGLHYDTLELYFDVSDYNHGWICWGFSAWPYTSADEDSHRVHISAAYGTESIGSGYFDKWIAMNNRGLDVDTYTVANTDTMKLDTLLVPDSDTLTLYDSLFVIPIEKQLEGGDVDVDSTGFLDVVMLRMVFCDSALIGDAVNKAYYTVRTGLIMKHD